MYVYTTNYFILTDLLGIKYKANTTINKKGLYVCSHAIDHVDLFSILNELINQNRKATIVVADLWWNHLLYNYILSIGINYIDFLYVNEYKKNGTVNKVVEILSKEGLVFIFLYKKCTSTGIHYMIKKSNLKPTICKIFNEETKNIDMPKYKIFIHNIFKTYNMVFINNYVYVNLKTLKEDLYNFK